jgi:hypothetical protein
VGEDHIPARDKSFYVREPDLLKERAEFGHRRATFAQIYSAEKSDVTHAFENKLNATNSQEFEHLPPLLAEKKIIEAEPPMPITR